MWRCFNRGVWETLDRSVTVFKVDTSNGTCLISSLAKDIDGKSEDFKRNKPQPCTEDKFGVCHVSDEGHSVHEHQARRQAITRTVKLHDNASTSKVFSRDLRHFEVVTASPIFDKSPPSISEESRVRPCNGRQQPPHIVNSCTGRTISGKCELQCSCDRRPSPDIDYISESQHVDKGRSEYLDVSSEAKCKPHSELLSKSTKNVGISEERRKLNSSSSKLDESCLSKGNFLSFVDKVALLRDDRDVREKIIVSPNKEIQSHELVHSNLPVKSSHCSLKLPFLHYDFGRFKGLNQVSSSWLIKPRSEFGRGDSGGSGGEQSGESEEKKEDAWRECQMHQSLLEAIGWSSAVLLGWFLGQFRFRHIHGELNRDNNLENKRKCCIIGSLAKMLVTLRDDTTLPLKVLPNKSDGISKEHRKKKGSKVHKSEATLINEPYECPPNPFPLLEKEDINARDRHSSLSYLIQQKSEDTSHHKDHLRQKLSYVSGAQKSNVIPMPWYPEPVNNLAHGPITLEDAMKEAGKELEEAQAEVLLTLALEKLNKGCNLTQHEPLPADLLQSAASLGSMAAAFNLGICYEKGVGGVVKDLIQAYHWYKEASEQGHAAATYNLAVFHANGLGGLQPNASVANLLLLKASALGLEEATNALDAIYSSNSSEILHDDEDYLSLRNHVSLDQDNEESSNSLIMPHMSKSCSSVGVENKQASMSMFSESYHGSNNDLSGIVSQPSKYLKEISKMSSSKISHLPMPHGLVLNNSVDTGRPLLEEIMFDDHQCIKNKSIDSSSVQLLAH